MWAGVTLTGLSFRRWTLRHESRRAIASSADGRRSSKSAKYLGLNQRSTPLLTEGRCATRFAQSATRGRRSKSRSNPRWRSRAFTREDESTAERDRCQHNPTSVLVKRKIGLCLNAPAKAKMTSSPITTKVWNEPRGRRSKRAGTSVLSLSKHCGDMILFEESRSARSPVDDLN
jgi:hypothetical protein